MLTIYTDGACSGNPGPGAWAFVVLENDQIINQKSDFVNNTTNNQMELIAAINALKEYPKANIFVDSIYVKEGITNWINNWKKNNWKTINNKPVKNLELWKELDSLNNSNINWNWIKGHANNMHDLADKLATSTLKKNLNLI